MKDPVYCVVRVDRDDMHRLPVAPVITVEPNGSDSMAVSQALRQLASTFHPGVEAEPTDNGLVRVTINAQAPREVRVVTLDLERWHRTRRIML